MKFSLFMAGMAGRLLRVIVGLGIIIGGLAMQSTVGYIVAAVGLLPLAAGAFDWCILAPLLRVPFSGKAIRACSVE